MMAGISAAGAGKGLVRFARYAYPPNALGYCGPDQPQALLEQAAAGVVDPDLGRMARGFDGAWPYLELIAHVSKIEDPVDERVVEAYWLGGPLLHRVGPAALHSSLERRFKPRMGRRWGALGDTPLDGCVPHHNFHVFVVYPWVGMLRLGHVTEPLRVLDRCRIRWGRVEQTAGSLALVRVRPLVYDGLSLGLGPSVIETAHLSLDGHSLAMGVRTGDFVSLHWDWVCEHLEASHLRQLVLQTKRALAAANAVLRRPGGSVLE